MVEVHSKPASRLEYPIFYHSWPGNAARIRASPARSISISAHMNSVETFMREYFRARIEDERSYQKARLPFRNRYFTATCSFDSHSETLKRLESETILITQGNSDAAMVITEQQFAFRGTVKKLQHRYSLVHEGEGWRINEVVPVKLDGNDLR